MARFNKILFLFIALTVFSACTTQKRKGDVGKLAKFYHNTTAEFNGYFNADELFNESIVQLNNEYVDNYNKILPVFKYVATDNPKAVAGNLDAAIEKVSIVATIHRVSDWTDDCYLLLGKSQYVKQDYESAEETLEYLKAEYNPEILSKLKKSSKKKIKNKKKKKNKEIKKKRKKAVKQAKKRKAANKKLRKARRKNSSRKKKKSSSRSETVVEESKSNDTSTKETETTAPTVPDKSETDPNDGGLFKKPPAYQEGLLWLARTYIERQSYTQAQFLLEQLATDSKLQDHVRRQLPAVQAHYFLKQKQYDSAIAPLETAINVSKDKEEKARYAYIIAQIHQKAGRGQQSYAYFDKVDKYSDFYELRFSAKLKMAQNDYLNGNATSEQISKDLEKMIKDIKNEEYRDQIYYTLADIALDANKKPEAIGYLKKSLQFSSGKSAQKVESYYLLADLYYEGQQFVNAKNYFDSTLTVMPKTDERFDLVTAYSKNLTEIAANIIIIQEQDSILAISKLSPEEKEALAYEIQKQREEDRLNKLKNNINKPADKFGNRVQQSRPGSTSIPSSFFAYDERNVKKGQKEFQKTWNDRPLEDNWRRSNRRGAGSEIQDDEVVIRKEIPSGILTEDDIADLLKEIPNSPEEIKAVEDKLIDAMYALGSLYRDRLQLNDKTVAILEELDTRFPGNKHELDSWYFLYLAHTDLGNLAKAKEYYDKIVSKHSASTYAKVLQDPNFLENSKEEERKVNTYYNQTYAAFESGKYDDAAQRAVQAAELFGHANILQPRFALLNAMCLGNLQGVEAYKKELTEIISKYPDTPEQTRAREILRLLGGQGVSVEDKEKVGGENKKDKSENEYKIEDNRMHYCIIVLKNNSISLTEAKAAVSDYHTAFHKIDKLRIANVYLGADTSTPILVIRRFKSKELAMGYFNGVSQNSSSFLPENAEYEVFPITQNNYRQVLKNKELESYKAFFQQNY